MTYKDILNHLLKLSESQLSQTAVAYDSCHQDYYPIQLFEKSSDGQMSSEQLVFTYY